MSIEKLLIEFKTYKIDVEGRTESSIDLYIKNFREFCKDMKINDYNKLIEVKAQDIKDWISLIAKKDNSPITRNNKLSSVKQIFAYLEDEKMVLVDRQISKIKYAKTRKKEVKFMDETEMEQLLYVTTNERTKSAIAVLIKTGIRFSEMLQITCTDIERGFSTILGKGNKERTIYFPPSCIAICKKYINGKRKRIIEKTGVKTDLLFISDNGNTLDASNFINSLKYWAKKTGIYWSDEMSPHKLRHSYITKALNDGVPPQVVRDIVGHQNMSTTSGYAHTKEDAIKNAMLRED